MILIYDNHDNDLKMASKRMLLRQTEAHCICMKLNNTCNSLIVSQEKMWLMPMQHGFLDSQKKHFSYSEDVLTPVCLLIFKTGLSCY